MSMSMSDEQLMGEVYRRIFAIKEKEKEFYQHLIRQSQRKRVRIYFSGSRSEIRGQENMLHIWGINRALSDMDLMFCSTSVCVLTRRQPAVPNYFDASKVARIYSHGLRSGFIKLYYENYDAEYKRTDVLPVIVGDIHGPAATLKDSRVRECNKTAQRLISEESWIASQHSTTVAEQDRVLAVHSQHWPLEVNEWITRPRLYGLPSKSIIKEVVRYGCDFVAVSHKLSTADNEWRFSFSKAELTIINSWTTSQRIVYRTFHVLNKMIKSENYDSKLCSYYFKTFLLWATEEKPAEFWSQEILSSVYELLFELMQWLKRKFFPNYFVPTNNMIDHLADTDLHADVDVLYQQLKNPDLIVSILRTSTLVEVEDSNQILYIDGPVWLYTSLLITEHIQYCEDRVTRLFAENSSVLLQKAITLELSNIYHGLSLNDKARSCVTRSYKDNTCILMKSIEYFQGYEASYYRQYNHVACCSSNTARFVIPSWLTRYKPSSQVSHLAMANYQILNAVKSCNGLTVDYKETDQKCLLYSQSMNGLDQTMRTDHFSENVCNKTKIRIAVHWVSRNENKPDPEIEFYKEFHGMTPTVNISWFVNKAYLANLYYTTQQDYTATEKTCDSIIHTSKQSVGNEEFAESGLPLILSTLWTAVYDKDLQAMLGLYSLITFIFNKTSRSRFVYLGVSPVLFAMYLKNRCAVDQMNVKRLKKCVIEILEHINDYKDNRRVYNGSPAVNVVLMVIERKFKPFLWSTL